MIDKALAGLSPVQTPQQSYYFQLYPLSLTIIGEQSTVPAPGTTYKFTVFKGQQKFDETKLPIEANYKNINGVNLMVMPKCPINFYAPTFNKNRKTEFQFQMYQFEESNEYFIADYVIDIEPYIVEYKNLRTVRFEHKSKFSEDYELQFEIYVEKSRFALEKVVKDYKHERSLKSPLRQRKEPSPSKRISPSKKNLTNEYPVKQEKTQINRQQSKIQREEVTEISQSRNRKVEESQKSLKNDSKKVSVRNSRINSPAIQTPKEEEHIAHSSRLQPAIQQKKERSKIKQQSVKQKSESSSVNKLPTISTGFKPIAKEDTPKQVQMTSSQRLGSVQPATVELPKKQKVENTKQKILMALFLVVSLFLMYQSMHPNKKA